MKDLGNAATERRFASLWLESAKANGDAIASARTADALLAPLAGRAVRALVCGAGPSLDEVLPGIAAARDRFQLVCADAALRPLLSAGIRPDFAVTVDGDPEVAGLFADLPRRDTPWLVPSHVAPAALRAAPGEPFFYQPLGGSPALERIAAELHPTLPRVPAKGNAGHQALLFAAALRPRSIALAGLDFALTGDRFYARGVSRPEAAWAGRAELESRLGAAAFPALDLDGRAVLTLPAFARYAATLQAECLASRDFAIVQLSGGIMRRLPRRTLEEWIS